MSGWFDSAMSPKVFMYNLIKRRKMKEFCNPFEMLQSIKRTTLPICLGLGLGRWSKRTSLMRSTLSTRTRMV